MHLLTYEPIVAELPDTVLDEWRKQPWLQPVLQSGRSLAEALCHPEALRRAREFIAPWEIEVMRLIVTTFGSQPFALEPLIQACASRLGGAEAEAGLIGLRRKGFIGTFRKSWGDLLFVLPWSGFCAWRRMLFPEQAAALLLAETEQAQPSFADNPGLAQLVFMLLLTAALEPLALTRRGILSKRAIQRLYKAASWPDDELRSVRTPYVFSDIYQPGLAIVLDFAISRRLLTRSREHLVINSDEVLSWMELGIHQQNAELYRYWLTIGMPADVRMQSIIALIQDIPAGRTATIALLREAEHSGEMANPEDESAWLEQLLGEWLRPLAAFGWLEFEINEDRELLVRTCLYPAADDLKAVPAEKFYVQPDFEIIVPPGVPAVIRWRAALFAELLTWDEIMVLKLTKSSFYSACERGGDCTDKLLAFLREHAQYELPENVTETMKGWGLSYGRAQIMQGATVLQCQDEQVAAAISGSERCQAYIWSRLGPRAFLIKGDQIRNMMRTLESLDIYPRMFAGETIEADEDGGKSHSENPAESGEIQRLFMIHDIGSLYKAETKLPSADEIYAGIEQIPVLWWKETRDYHVSTRKEIIRKAIEWRSYLKLRKAEAEWTVRPIRLEEYAGSWSFSCLEGEREVRLMAEDWDAMQLILPGKHAFTN